jgi:hypothetical protein
VDTPKKINRSGKRNHIQTQLGRPFGSRVNKKAAKEKVVGFGIGKRKGK